MEVQLRDFQGNAIDPKGGGGTPTNVPASNVSIASGTGLQSSNAQGAFKELNDKIEQSGGGGGESATFDVAKGSLDESCLINDAANSYVGYVSIQGKMPKVDNNTNVVMVSLDDFKPSDYIGTRKINNKYNFRTTYNYDVKPPSTTEIQERIVGGKKMVADGNELGLHSICVTSYFWRNLMYDVRPDGTTSFSPTLAELKTVVSGGKNIFGQTITASTTFSNVRLGGDTSVANVLLSEATQAQWLTAVSFYSVYASSMTYAGCTLTNTSTMVRKSVLGWLEYWYNELIDNTLGYSSAAETISARFAEDYEGTYPDVAHILSGDLANYGHFTKGLFKGCHSCCNFEVLDRIISVSEAVAHIYCGLKNFTNMAYHGGSTYANIFWTGQDGKLYMNRDCTVIATGHTPLYMSLKGHKMSLFDVALAHGIRTIKRQDPRTGNLEGEIALYRGQRHVRGAFFNDINDQYHINQYLALLGTAADGDAFGVSYDTLMQYMPEDYSEWHKFTYENAGVQLAEGVYVRDLYKTAIDCIRRAMGTGKIPTLGFDVNQPLPSMMAGLELLYQWCFKHNIRVCPMIDAFNISNEERNVSGNIFPNPSFYQVLIDDFGGSSTSPDAYIPDGFYKEGESVGVSVTKVNNDKVLTLTGGSDVGSLATRVYGLPSGKYRISMMAKSVGNSGCVKVYNKLNKDVIVDNPTLLTTLACGSDYAELYYDVTIPEPHKNLPDGTYANTVCDGYEDNVAFIQISFEVAANGSMSVYNPTIDKV